MVSYITGDQKTFKMRSPGLPINVTPAGARALLTQGVPRQRPHPSCIQDLCLSRDIILEGLGRRCCSTTDTQSWEKNFNELFDRVNPELEHPSVSRDSGLAQLFELAGGDARSKDYRFMRERKMAYDIVDGITYRNGPCEQAERNAILSHAKAVLHDDLYLESNSLTRKRGEGGNLHKCIEQKPSFFEDNGGGKLKSRITQPKLFGGTVKNKGTGSHQRGRPKKIQKVEIADTVSMEPEQTKSSMPIVKDTDFYERQRADNIARNNAFLSAIGVNINEKTTPEKQRTKQKSRRRSEEDSNGDSDSDLDSSSSESVQTAATCNTIESDEADNHAEFSSCLAEKVGKYFIDKVDGGRFKVIKFGLSDDAENSLCFQYITVEEQPREGDEVLTHFSKCSEMMAPDGWVEWLP